MLENFSESPISWFPGHIAGAKTKIIPQIAAADLFLEIADARAPLTSRAAFFARAHWQKKRVLLLNKQNLASQQTTKEWQQYFREQNIEHLFCDFHQAASLKKVFMLIRQHQRRAFAHKSLLPFRVVIAGVPNTGKTTLINRLLKKNRLKVGPKPGETKILHWVELDDNLELLDSPGIFTPNAVAPEKTFILFLIHAVASSNNSLLQVADCLLQILWQNQDLWQAKFAVQADNSAMMREALMKKWGILPAHSDREELFARKLIHQFQAGRFGAISLEQPPQEPVVG